MNKTLLIMVCALLVASVFAVPAMAKDDTPRPPPPTESQAADARCVAEGFDFGIAAWKYKNDVGFEKKAELAGYATSVVGNKTVADWTSAPDAAGVLVEGVSTPLSGGASGSIVKGGNIPSNKNIETVTICGNTPVDVPEFGMLAAGLVMAAGIGLVVFRRK
jgi:hypothetical protein